MGDRDSVSRPFYASLKQFLLLYFFFLFALYDVVVFVLLSFTLWFLSICDAAPKKDFITHLEN